MTVDAGAFVLRRNDGKLVPLSVTLSEANGRTVALLTFTGSNVIGGSLAAFGDAVLVPLRAEIQRRALWDAQARLTIAPSRLGDDVGPIGGAALCLTRIDLSTLLAPAPAG